MVAVALGEGLGEAEAEAAAAVEGATSSSKEPKEAHEQDEEEEEVPTILLSFSTVPLHCSLREVCVQVERIQKVGEAWREEEEVDSLQVQALLWHPFLFIYRTTKEDDRVGDA
ncbi:hypothetical protein Cni_G20098 [Canna indica]|uniref:Uncharacterized protein n=1 Tax=Canna indica TaxID=4628 RepID=A0AAQ3KSL4_9LILI|nr:hypothetical protein Cni_G20098 [Canna indica]